MRARGLKLITGIGIKNARKVAPHAGAWIETLPLCRLAELPVVAVGDKLPVLVDLSFPLF